MTGCVLIGVRSCMPAYQKATLISDLLAGLARRYGCEWRMKEIKRFPDLECDQYEFEIVGGDLTAWAAELAGTALPPMSVKYTTFTDSSGLEFGMN